MRHIFCHILVHNVGGEISEVIKMSKRLKRQENNICGKWIRYIRLGLYNKSHPKITQEQLVARVQVLGLKIDRTALSRIERSERYLSDIEVVCFAKALDVSPQVLICGPDNILPEISSFVSIISEDD